MDPLAKTEPGAARQSPSNLSLGSNNPFRNRTTSPSLASPTEPSARPVSRNPFLDPATQSFVMSSPEKPSSAVMSTNKRPLNGSAAELFDNLTLGDQDEKTDNLHITSKDKAPARMAPPIRAHTDTTKRNPASRSENIKSSGHRSSRSQEQALRHRASGRSNSRSKDHELDVFADPSKEASPRRGDASARQSRPRPRPRRNSDSSIQSKPLDPEEEKKRLERKRKEKERRHRERTDGKARKGKLDIIDQLDATSIYGTGLFHHDGPFDACNPQRNRQGSRRAPMQAFAKDSLNNIIGGSGPINKRPDHDTFLMRNDDEAFQDFSGKANVGEGYSNPRSNGNQDDTVIVDSAKIKPVHGDESLGLGTSTFLEGAPASRAAVVRNQAEAREAPAEGGLARHKSLAQKFRGMSQRRNSASRVTSPDGGALGSPESPICTPGGGRQEANPFFQEYSKGDDSTKNIGIAETTNGRARAPSSPKRTQSETAERRMTSDSSNNDGPRTSGFLSRVKSLKGGSRRPAPPRPVAEPTAQ